MVESDPDGHVDPDALFRYATGVLAPERAVIIGRHLEGCGACRAELGLARAFAATPDSPLSAELEERMRTRLRQALEGSLPPLPTPAPAPPPPPPPRLVEQLAPGAPAASGAGRARRPAPRWWRATAASGWIAAAAIVIAGVVTWQALQSARQVHPTGVQRGAGKPGTWIPAVVLTAEDRVRIAWDPLPEAEAYHVQILTVAGRTVWQTQTLATATEVARSQFDLQRDAGQPLLARVTALGAGGFRRESDVRELPAPAAASLPH